LLFWCQNQDFPLLRDRVRASRTLSMCRNIARTDAMNATPPAHRTTSALAVVSLVSGIAAWCVLPVVGAIVAVVCGHMGRGEIRRSQGQLEGDGLAVIGLVFGYVQLAFGFILLLFAIAAVVLGLSIGFGSSFFH